MSHLDPDRLAALADNEPTPPEVLHLRECAACAHEREAYRTLLLLAHEEGSLPAVPLSKWDAIAEALRAGGVPAPASAAPPAPAARAEPSVVPIRRPRGLRLWMQVAAAIALVAGGAVGGALLGPKVVKGDPTDAGFAQGPRIERPDPSGTRLVGDTLAGFRSIAEAQASLTRAEREYRQAMMFLAANDTAVREFRNADVYRARLAALDAMAGAAQQGVLELPHDPMINQYYMSTLAAREATLRQLSSTLPAGVRLTGF
jgi:hypothetical protein